MLCLKQASRRVYRPAESIPIDVIVDRSITRWALSSRRASASASLRTGAVSAFNVPETVHTVVPG
jgi:hypothetical protein